MTEPRRISEAELHAYIDGELTPDDRAEVEALLAADPEARELARTFVEINGALAARYAPTLAEPLPDRVAQLVGRVPWRVPWRIRAVPAIAASLLLICAAGTAGYVARALYGPDVKPAPESSFVATALSAHTVYVPEVRHPVEVGAAEEKHLMQWLTKRIGADVRAPVLAPLGWKLIGGRLLPDQGAPAAQFMYEDPAGRRLTLYMRKETGSANTAFHFAERNGFGAFYWIDRPMAYALAGRLNRDDLMGVANAVYAQLEAAAAAAKPAPPPPGR